MSERANIAPNSLSPDARPLQDLLGSLDPVLAGILDRALEGRAPSANEAVTLFKASGLGPIAMSLVADELRRRSVGDVVTYVAVRNVNFTNVCTMGCRFCAFSRKPHDSESYLLSVEEVVEKAGEAFAAGCTEVCLQGGINPSVPARYYVDLIAAIKRRFPALHLHAFSPFEVHHAARKAGRTVRDWLCMLRDAGLGSLPGTAAEIFDPRIRKLLAPHKISTAQWVSVVKTAHRLGIPSTATIMYGHLDGPEHWAAHLALIREIQRETNGFSEFVPLGFVHEATPLYLEGLGRPGPTGLEDLKMHAVARLMLNDDIKNVQVSWVKLGPKMAQVCLNAGANDFGGTLIEERISSAAGAIHGQSMAPHEFRRLTRDLGRIPAQRNTTYEILRIFDSEDE